VRREICGDESRLDIIAENPVRLRVGAGHGAKIISICFARESVSTRRSDSEDRGLKASEAESIPVDGSIEGASS
jgi:hypothetical protein